MDELSLFTVAVLDSRIASREKSFHSLGCGTTKPGDTVSTRVSNGGSGL